MTEEQSQQQPKPTIVYKVCTVADYEELQKTGALPMSGADAKDGFVHLSVGEELVKTLNLYYATCASSDLRVLAVNLLPGEGGNTREVKWEFSKSRNAFFPHLYGGPLEKGAVIKVIPVTSSQEVGFQVNLN